MKKVVILIIAIFSTALVYAQGVNWETGTLEEALAKASKDASGKNLVFLDCYTQWCGPCKKMINDVFPTKEAGDFFNGKFVNIKLDMDAEPNRKHAAKYGVRAYPTFLILNPDGTEVARVVGGAADADKFIKRVEEALNPSNNPDMLLEQFEKSQDAEFLFKYFEKLEKDYNNKRIREYISANYDKLPLPLQYTPGFWKYILQSVSIVDVTVLNKVLANKVNYDRLVGKERVDKDLYNRLKEELGMYIFKGDAVPYSNVARFCEVMMLYTDGSRWDQFSVDLALLFAKGEYDKVSSCIDAGTLPYFLTAMECEQLIEMIMDKKEIPDTGKAKILRDYRKALDEVQGRLLKHIEKYKDVVIPDDMDKAMQVLIR